MLSATFGFRETNTIAVKILDEGPDPIFVGRHNDRAGAQIFQELRNRLEIGELLELLRHLNFGADNVGNRAYRLDAALRLA